MTIDRAGNVNTTGLTMAIITAMIPLIIAVSNISDPAVICGRSAHIGICLYGY